MSAAVLALALCCLLTVGATRGAFSANATNSANNFQAASSFGCATPGSQTVSSTADTTADQATPNTNYGSRTWFEVNSGSSSNARGLVRFSLPTLPAGCSVTSAVLKLTVDFWFNSGRTLQARRVTSSWVENTATWANQPTSTTTSQATAASGPGPINFTVTQQVIDMYAGSNDGFLIRDANEDDVFFNDGSDFATREDGAGTAPKLTVTYG